MKKIMIVLAAVAMTAVAQAASVSWTCTNVKDSKGSTITGVAYFLTTDMLSYSDAQALAGKGAAAVTTALGSAYSYTGTSGAFGNSAGVANATLGLTGGTDYTVYLMIFDTATVADTSKFYLTATKSLLTYEGAEDLASVKFGNQSALSQAAGAWSAVSAPEPTSGLLILVGGALLALRRRRA